MDIFVVWIPKPYCPLTAPIYSYLFVFSAISYGIDWSPARRRSGINDYRTARRPVRFISDFPLRRVLSSIASGVFYNRPSLQTRTPSYVVYTAQFSTDSASSLRRNVKRTTIVVFTYDAYETKIARTSPLHNRVDGRDDAVSNAAGRRAKNTTETVSVVTTETAGTPTYFRKYNPKTCFSMLRVKNVRVWRIRRMWFFWHVSQQQQK